MIKAVVFDVFETLITLFNSELYKGKEIACEMGIPEKVFREIWDPSEDYRTVGLRTFEDVITEILNTHGIYSQELYDTIVSKRYRCTAGAFEHKSPDIIPMLKALKEKGIKTGIITNCYFEERDAILKSDLYPYFDTICMSCEEGIKKPDRKIYELCIERLGVKPEECLFVGDGGSNELEAAMAAGMKVLQATWYLKDGTDQPVGELDGFGHAKVPADVLKAVG